MDTAGISKPAYMLVGTHRRCKRTNLGFCEMEIRVKYARQPRSSYAIAKDAQALSIDQAALTRVADQVHAAVQPQLS